MENYKIVFPDEFEDYEWEVESKGWLNNVLVEFQDKTYRLIIYDPVRLSQDISEELSSNNVFAESNMVVIKVVNRENIEKSVSIIANSNGFKNFKREG
jgi:hypothetical protein